MKNDPLFWELVGYLSNGIRRTDIHAEMHPKKEAEFRNEYLGLTGERLSWPGDSEPFYVWPPGANKYGVQLRVYFQDNGNPTPQLPEKIRVVSGRAKGKLRINSGPFVRVLFEVGFLLGKKADYADTWLRAPRKFISDFGRGFNMLSPLEEMEKLVLEHCESQGSRTEKASTLEGLWQKHGYRARDLLKSLCENRLLVRNERHKFVHSSPS